MNQRDIVVIGGSAGAISSLRTLLHGLPPDFPAAIAVVLHRTAEVPDPDSLADALRGATRLRVYTASDGNVLTPGRVYVAPPDRHLLVENGVLRLEHSPKEQFFRPGIDILFKSAASVYGRRLIAVLLSGRSGGDGSAGLWQVKAHGGVTMVQDPATTDYDTILRNAMESVEVDHILSPDLIAGKLIELTAHTHALPRAMRPTRVLIVEDESVVAANLREHMIEMGYDPVDWVVTGEEAMEAAERERPDLVLMDIRLAGNLSGIEAARGIWRKLQIPIVYCTALADMDTLESVKSPECYGYVVKPFHAPAVRVAIELALSRRERELRHLPQDA